MMSSKLGNPIFGAAVPVPAVTSTMAAVSPPRMAPAGPKRLRSGQKAAVPKVRYRTGVHGNSRFTRLTTLDFTGQFLPQFMVIKGLMASFIPHCGNSPANRGLQSASEADTVRVKKTRQSEWLKPVLIGTGL